VVRRVSPSSSRRAKGWFFEALRIMSVLLVVE